MADPITAGLVISGAIGIVSNAAAYNVKRQATNLKIDETIQDYEDQISEYKAKKAGDQAIATFDMESAGKDNAYRAIASRQEGALNTGAARAGLGFSGVQGQSPLMALAQTERMGQDATNETIRAGNTGLRGAGLRYTTLTADYNRAIAFSKGKQQYLRDNRQKMVGLASAGEAIELVGSVARFGMKMSGI